ncbi:MAG TPA: GNAT family N-acetyltransferase [Streptosporangiaceae bacterium]|nr:GNAT family N-acetyltransferase [Streptosporangiaceae bacterium]
MTGPERGGPVTAGPADAGALSGVVAAAFHDLEPSRWLIADPAVRREIFPGYFAIFVEHVLAAGVVHTTPDRAAAALWLPAGDGTAAPPDGYDTRLAAVTGPYLSRFQAFDEALDQRHPGGVPHHHLAMMAVRPDRQGQGTGTALLRAYLRGLDQAGMPSYLEAASLRTRAIYLKHGYADHGPPIRLGGDGPSMYPMWRESAGTY